MKTMKKLLAVLVAAMLLASLTVAAFADDETITITINTQEQADQESTNETYTAYRVLDVTRTDAAETANDATTPNADNAKGYAYTTTNSALADALVASTYFSKTESVNGGLFNLEATNALTKDNQDAAAAILAIAKAQNITGQAIVANDDGVLQLSTAPGYYVIESSLGVNLILATSNVTMVEKNEYPTVAISADQTASIGDTVTFTVTVRVPRTYDTTKDLIVHGYFGNLEENGTGDNAEVDGLTFVSSTSEAVTLDTDVNSDYGFKFKATAAQRGTDVTVTVTAKVNENAVIAGDGNKNSVYLDYSNYETPAVSAVVKTYAFTVNKVDGQGTVATDDDTLITNDDAVFELYNGDTQIFVKKIDNGNYQVDTTATSGDDILVGKTAQGVVIYGIKNGEYKLKETAAPDGYNALTAPHDFTVTEAAATSNVENVINNSGAILPSTGGIGTTIFTVVGAALMVGAAVLFVAKKRTGIED